MGKSSINGPCSMAMLNNQRASEGILDLMSLVIAIATCFYHPHFVESRVVSSMFEAVDEPAKPG